jgi:hypothetical protein
MKTYLFKVVKIEKSIVAQNKYRCLNRINPNIATVPGTVAPEIYRSTKTNQYLLDIKHDNIEFLRFIANTLIQAEKSLFPNDRFLFVLVYECELGKAIGNETPMTLLLDVTINKPFLNSIHDSGEAYLNSAIEPTPFYTWRSWYQYRHTARGSGRYNLVYVKDPPLYFTQRCLMINDVAAVKKATNDDFIGLSVVFERELGAALKSVYMGAASSGNYYLNATGNIVFHRRGDIYHGAFDSYRKAFSAIWPLLSARQFDKDGALIEAAKVTANAKPNLVSEFKAQRRAAYTKAGNSERFKTRLIVMLSDLVSEFCKFINDVQRWGHNLNYDVVAFKKTKVFYLKSERILRLISSYFPQELPLDALRLNALSSTTPIAETETLVLGNRFQESAECWDRLVLLLDWMRRNYVDYKIRDGIPNYTKTFPDTRRAEYTYLGDGYESDGIYDQTEEGYQWWMASIQASMGLTGKMDIQHASKFNGPAGTTHYQDRFNLRFKDVEATQFSGPGKSATWDVQCFKVTNTGKPGGTVNRGWSEYNQWLEKTAEIAADIEEIYLSYQLNALAFIELLAHLLTILDSKPRAGVTRKEGALPGEIPVSSEQKKNKKRIYPKALPRVADNRTEGKVQDIPTPKIAMPDFKPLQIDARGIIKRCAKDFSQRDDDEQQEEDKKRQAANNELDRQAFQEQQDEIERRKLKSIEKPRFKWRNEIDDLTPTEQYNERVSLYNEIADNLNTVVDVADAVNDVVGAFALLACPPATPLVVGEKVAFKVGKSAFKTSIRKVARRSADIEWPDLPEFDDATAETEIDTPELPSAPEGEVPRPRVRHKYKPPRKDDTPEFTGDEPDAREWEPCEKNPDYQPDENGVYVITKFAPARSNEVDLQVVESYEPGGARQLVQTGLKYFDDVVESLTDCIDFAESNPQSRYRCIRATKRVPRA